MRTYVIHDIVLVPLNPSPPSSPSEGDGFRYIWEEEGLEFNDLYKVTMMGSWYSTTTTEGVSNWYLYQELGFWSQSLFAIVSRDLLTLTPISGDDDARMVIWLLGRFCTT